MKTYRKFLLFGFGLLLALLAGWTSPTSSVSADEPIKLRRVKQQTLGNFVIHGDANGAHCQEASIEEVAQIVQPPDLQKTVLRPITPPRAQADGGLKIMLMGTQQLEGFPQAKNAFIRAAAIWESIIQTPITIILNVDFGPTRFGTPFPSGVLGSTASQVVGANNIFADIRQGLIDSETAGTTLSNLYNTLPPDRLTTDIGATTAIASPATVFRALKILPAVANPMMENLGPPPSIGFNSNFQFDFDPTDGIDPLQIDFEATAVHEIGHALGFTSAVGLRELNPNVAISPSVWDIFRFRPGIDAMTFGNSQRIQSSGGDQLFFVGGTPIPLSTGRPNASGGDGAQSSHWKARRFVGTRIGIMDPFLSNGERVVVTDSDRLAIDAFGYAVAAAGADFRLLLNTPSQEVRAGQSANFMLDVMAVGGFAQNVTFNVTSSSNNLTTSLSANQTTAGNPITLTVTPAANAPMETATLTITATSGSIVRTVTATVNILANTPDFNLGFDVVNFAVRRGQRTTINVLVNRINNFDGSVTITAPNTKGLRVAITPTMTSTTNSSIPFTFQVKKKAPVGQQQLTFTAVDASGRVRSATTTLTIQ